MPNPIFANEQQNSQNPIMGMLQSLRGAMGGDPQALFDQMYQSNPQFRDFANSMKGKDPKQAFAENGFNYDQIRGMMGR
jgi:hypothetical protein